MGKTKDNNKQRQKNQRIKDVEYKEGRKKVREVEAVITCLTH
jgi:hypothetical protein